MDDQPQAGSEQTQEASAEELQTHELEKLEQSFAKVSSYKNPLQHEQALAKESRDLNIPLDEYRRLYELSQKEFSTPTKLHKFWKWTGIGEKKGWDLVQLFFVPIAIYLATGYLGDQAKTREKEAAKDHANQETLNSYLDEMTKLLPDLRKKSTVDVKAIAKTRTLTALRALDSERNTQILGFLREAGLIGGDLSKVSKVDLRKANLHGAHLENANLSDIDISNVNLAGADLRNANLSGRDLSTVTLAGADLKGTRLMNANLISADLTDSKLDETTNFREANLKDALGKITSVKANFCKTVMPDGKESKQVCSMQVDAKTGLLVRDRPFGYVIGSLDSGKRVGLTGATEYAGGHSWTQLSSGGWIASEYISLQPIENKSSPAWFFWNHGDK